jgi:4'-phosphopantetheinyl transferase
MTLREQDVHVWKARLDLPASLITPLQETLSPEERARAQRFYFERDRSHWAVARGLLRLLLAHYTHTDPREIRLQANAYGKPRLVFPPLHLPLQFNLSHSVDLALYAFSWQRHLGVDVEYMRTDIAYDELAQHSFSPSEQTALLHLPAEQKHQAFYNCWTRKEAYIKARGMGLSLPLDLFDVELLPGKPTALLHSREQSEEVSRWSMRELLPEAGYAGALVVEGHGWQLHCWRWPDLSISQKDR